MKKNLLFFRLLIKRQLKSVFFLLILILIPATAFVMSHISSKPDENNNRVALYARDEDEMANNTIKGLLEADSIYEFYLCENEQQLIDDVKKGAFQCGYIFAENISERIENGKNKGNVIAVYRSDSILQQAVRETFFSVFFKQVARKMALDYIAGSGEFPEMSEELKMYFDGTYDVYLNSDKTFHVNFETMEDMDSFEKTEIIEAKTVNFPLRGIMAVLIMTGALMGLFNWLSDKEKGVFMPMRYDFVAVSKVMYVAVPVLLLGVCGVVSVILSGEGKGIIYEAGTMLLYAAILVTVCTVAGCIIRKSAAVLSMMPVILIGSLFVCPVFMDFSLYVPVIKFIRYFFIPYYYIIMF